MNEMDELSRFRAEARVRGTARAEEIFRAALAEELSAERPVVSAARTRFRRLRPAWRLAIAVPLTLGLAAGVTVAVRPSGQPALTVQLLADRAAAAALASPPVSAGQWVYVQSEYTYPFPLPAGPHVQDGWMTADGTLNYGAGIIGDPIYPYDKLGSLPRDPAKLDAYFVSQDPAKTDDQGVVDFSHIRSMLFGMVLPPWLEAEMYHALALIPGIRVKDQVKDIAGRAGVAFVLPPTKQSEQQEIILDASDYHLLARVSWDDPSRPSSRHETAILKEYLVAELGSTQPSTAPPSAAELAAERIDFFQEHLINPPKINSIAPGQWLYRDLRTGGQDQVIWATADDSAQAEYVNGTLQVCQRTDPCAASEHWLMPAGPSYSLIYPAYPRPTKAEIRQYLQDLRHHVKAANPFKPPLPALPAYPRPLLDKLSTYSTGCADVAGDCNAVNVAANVLTGYGNYPSLNAVWFYALADVPGVSIQHITDAAGHDDIAFAFPAQDGVTAILVNASLLNAGTIQYEGYVRNGEQTLVLHQAPVSGPGVRP
ncbi:MAG TPA: CU044_5270 family protein [Streptosporangiaceae bacterium]|nr:CU044_5270 family protein [Streptosporangiaceae bacterium]